MISVEEAKKIAPELFEGLTDKQAENVRNSFYHMINLLIDDFVEKEEKKATRNE